MIRTKKIIVLFISLIISLGLTTNVIAIADCRETGCPSGMECINIEGNLWVCGIQGGAVPSGPGICEGYDPTGWCDGNTCRQEQCKVKISGGEPYCDCSQERNFNCDNSYMACAEYGNDCYCACGLEGTRCCGSSCESGLWCDTSPTPDICCLAGYYYNVDRCVAGGQECTSVGYNVFSTDPWYAYSYYDPYYGATGNYACCVDVWRYGETADYFTPIEVY